jgi:cytochrome c-type protein NapB
MSHPHLAHCTQCHAPARPQVPGVERQAPMAGNEFVGRAETSGERAWPGAPPTLPHATWMRQRCDSCHGVLAEGIHTTHPQRANCLQCHGPSARLDQWPALSRASTRAVPVRTRGDKP